MKNLLKLAAALVVISTSAPVFAAASISAPAPQGTHLKLENVMVSSAVGVARFTPPQFCWIGKVKVACDFTDVPPRDPGR